MIVSRGYTIQRSREALSTTPLHTHTCVSSSVPSRFVQRGYVRACASRRMHAQQRQTISQSCLYGGDTQYNALAKHYASAHPHMRTA
eukprot:2136087-Pyramimonas_sp.AAC.2